MYATVPLLTSRHDKRFLDKRIARKKNLGPWLEMLSVSSAFIAIDLCCCYNIPELYVFYASSDPDEQRK